jgi:Caspase domain
MCRRIALFFTYFLTMASTIASPVRAEVRVALVIGNGAYRNVPALPNPPNDAVDVGAALRRDGFDTIIAADLDEAGMEDAIIRFAREARDADIALFYYSGHALQFSGVNYLVPVDAKLVDETDLRRMTRVDEIVADLQQAKSLRILVLDACRNNPLADELKRSIGTTRALPLQRGLAKIDSPMGMIVAYATQAGRTAEDGTGRNSPYSTAFLKYVEAPEEIGTIFRRVSNDVYETTKHQQLPELSLSIIGEFYFHGGIPVDGKLPPAGDQQADSDEHSKFELAQRLNTSAGWRAFLKEYPNGIDAEWARKRVAELEPPDNNLPVESNSKQHYTVELMTVNPRISGASTVLSKGKIVFSKPLDPTASPQKVKLTVGPGNVASYVELEHPDTIYPCGLGQNAKSTRTISPNVIGNINCALIVNGSSYEIQIETKMHTIKPNAPGTAFFTANWLFSIADRRCSGGLHSETYEMNVPGNPLTKKMKKEIHSATDCSVE